MSWALWTADTPSPAPYLAGERWNGRDMTLALMTHGDAGVHATIPASPGMPGQDVLAASFQPLFDADFYNRLHLSITVLALGNVIGDQQRVVSVWNAYSYGVNLQQLQIANGEGITVSGQPLPPLGFGPLQERQWTVTIDGEGPPIINAAAQWVFDDGTLLQLTITGSRVTPWPWQPDWSAGILEALEWRTDVTESEEGSEQRIATRITPRQTWEFTSGTSGTDRQAMEAAMLGWTARVWALPLWPHGADLQQAAIAGTRVVMIATQAREFAPGGLAIFIGNDATDLEVVEVDQVLADRLLLKRDLGRTWPAAATIYPTKSARLTDATVSRFTGQDMDASVRFAVAQPNAYADTLDLPLYRGLPVLEDVPDWSEAPQLQPVRKIAEGDNGVGVPVWSDRTGFPVIRQGLKWAPHGREQVDRLRRLLYYLQGRLRAVWLPSPAEDMELAATSPAGSTTIDVGPCGYTAYLRGMPGRTDVRVQTPAGVQYLRITGSTVLANGNERIGLDAALAHPLDLANGDANLISFMTLARLDTDRVEWAWWSGDHGADNAHADVPLALRTYRNEL